MCGSLMFKRGLVNRRVAQSEPVEGDLDDELAQVLGGILAAEGSPNQWWAATWAGYAENAGNRWPNVLLPPDRDMHVYPLAGSVLERVNRETRIPVRVWPSDQMVHRSRYLLALSARRSIEQVRGEHSQRPCT